MNVVKVDFHGDTIDCIKKDGKIWVSVRRVCENLGLDAKSQREKLQNKSWSNGVIITSLDARGRNFRQFFVDIDTVPMETVLCPKLL